MNDQTTPPNILASVPAYKDLMFAHLTALQSLAAAHGLTVQTFGFAITFTEPGQNTAAYHGCACLTCASKTQNLMGKGILHTLLQINPDGADEHGPGAATTAGQVH